MLVSQQQTCNDCYCMVWARHESSWTYSFITIIKLICYLKERLLRITVVLKPVQAKSWDFMVSVTLSTFIITNDLHTVRKFDRVILTPVGFCVISLWSFPRFLSNHKKELLLCLLPNFNLFLKAVYPIGVTPNWSCFMRTISRNWKSVPDLD